MSKPLTLFLACSLLLAAVSPASADPWHARGPYMGPPYRDYPHWHEGRWFHGPHDGRMGWWWIAGDGWYFYSAPVYPYPDPYVVRQTVVVEPAQTVTVVRPAPVVVEQPAPTPMPTPAPALGQRELDDRQLNAYAVELQNIDLSDRKYARTALKDLGDRVEAFRQMLFDRTYNAMDILRDAERLGKRIGDVRDSLSKPIPKKK